jgi:predicted nucleotidyltransferase
MNPQTISELEQIKQIILKTVKADSIYLFGSHAYGTPTPDSDFDLYVVIPDDSIRPIEAMQVIGGALYKEQKKSIDILVSRTSDFQQRKLLPTIERTVARNGVRLYG